MTEIEREVDNIVRFIDSIVAFEKLSELGLNQEFCIPLEYGIFTKFV